MVAQVSALLLALFLTGCAPQKPYVVADEETYKAIAPAYLRYVEEDAKLDEAQKKRRRETVESWKARIDAAKEAAR